MEAQPPLPENLRPDSSRAETRLAGAVRRYRGWIERGRRRAPPAAGATLRQRSSPRLWACSWQVVWSFTLISEIREEKGSGMSPTVTGADLKACHESHIRLSAIASSVAG